MRDVGRLISLLLLPTRASENTTSLDDLRKGLTRTDGAIVHACAAYKGSGVETSFRNRGGTDIKDFLGARLAGSEAQMKCPTRLSETHEKSSHAPTAGLRRR
jgi:hypothetical protein